jgi:hypothetical protein
MYGARVGVSHNTLQQYLDSNLDPRRHSGLHAIFRNTNETFVDPKKNSDDFKLKCDPVLKLLGPLYGSTQAEDF